MQTLHLNEIESNDFKKHCRVTYSVQWSSLDKTWTWIYPDSYLYKLQRRQPTCYTSGEWRHLKILCTIHHLKQLLFFIVLSFSSPTLSLLHLVPIELESSHGCREDEGFLPCGGVVQPPRWFLPAHPVGRTGRNETQRCPDGLSVGLETSPGLLCKEELHR